MKDDSGKVVIDTVTGKPKKDPKTMKPFTVVDDLNEIAKLPEGEEKSAAPLL